MHQASPLQVSGPAVLVGLLVLATLPVLAILLVLATRMASTIEVVLGPLKITFRKRRRKRR